MHVLTNVERHHRQAESSTWINSKWDGCIEFRSIVFLISCSRFFVSIHYSLWCLSVVAEDPTIAGSRAVHIQISLSSDNTNQRRTAGLGHGKRGSYAINPKRGSSDLPEPSSLSIIISFAAVSKQFLV